MLGYAAYEAFRVAEGCKINAGVLDVASAILGFALGVLLFENTGALHPVVMDFVAATLVLVLAAGDGFVAKALRWKPITYLGTISFSIYLVHVPLLMVVKSQGYLRVEENQQFKGTLLQLV